MTLRKAHGKAGQFSPGPRVEVPPADELGEGLHVPSHGNAGAERDAGGRFQKGASSVQAAGGRGKRQKLALATRMGLGDLMPNPDFAPFHRAAQAFAAAERKRLREPVAGGQSSPAMDAVVSSAAWQKAVSEYLYEKAAQTGDVDTMTKASRMANDSRQNLLAAHHLAELAAKSAQNGPAPILLMPEPSNPPESTRRRAEDPPPPIVTEDPPAPSGPLATSCAPAGAQADDSEPSPTPGEGACS